MTAIASRGQLRMSFLRTALLVVPFILMLGMLSGWLSGSSARNDWYEALDKPSWTPPGAAFAIMWPILYILMGVALAQIMWARGSDGRGKAIALFAAQFALNLIWSPLFFNAHRVGASFWLILLIIVVAAATTWAFFFIRRGAGLLMLPYLAWLIFAAALNFEIDRRNPGAERLVPGRGSAEIAL